MTTFTIYVVQVHLSVPCIHQFFSAYLLGLFLSMLLPIYYSIEPSPAKAASDKNDQHSNEPCDLEELTLVQWS